MEDQRQHNHPLNELEIRQSAISPVCDPSAGAERVSPFSVQISPVRFISGDRTASYDVISEDSWFCDDIEYPNGSTSRDIMSTPTHSSPNDDLELGAHEMDHFMSTFGGSSDDITLLTTSAGFSSPYGCSRPMSRLTDSATSTPRTIRYG